MLCPDIAKGTIAHLCGNTCWNCHRWYETTPCPYTPQRHPQFPYDTARVGTPKQIAVWTRVLSKDLGKALRQVVYGPL